jgi:glutathione S-transferase
MKLYTFDAAPNPARLAMFMQYKGISIETVQIDLGSEEQLTDSYLSVVPEATVPALILDDGSVLCAVIAIVHYLEEQFPDKPLLGKSSEERARVLNWNHRLFGEIFSAVAEVFRNGHPNYVDRALPGPKNVAQVQALVERGTARLEQGFAALNEVLSEQPFLAGEDFSFADIDLLAAIDFAKWGARMSPDESLEHLHRWRKEARAALTA